MSYEENYPLISVITPAYNHENYVQQTILSILEQDYPNLEYIILNDGSTDNTNGKISELLPLCRHKLNKIHYINKENQGLSKTLNQAIDLAQGEFIFLIASDDYICDKQAISKLYNLYLINKDAVFFCGDALIVDQYNKRIYWGERQKVYYENNKYLYPTFVSFHLRRRYNLEEFGSYASFLKGNYIPVGLLIKKSIFKEIGYFNENLALEDLDMWFRISKKYKFKFLNEVIVAYRWHNSNTVKIYKDKLLEDNINILQREKEYCIQNNLYKEWKYAISKSIQYMIFKRKISLLNKNLSRDNYFIVAYSILGLLFRLTNEIKYIVKQKILDKFAA